MKIENEIKFWKEAKKIIRQGYGKSCKEFNLSCSACQANLVYSWIDNHIALLKWK